MGTLIAGGFIFLAGFIVGAFVFRNNPITGERIAQMVEDRIKELKGKL